MAFIRNCFVLAVITLCVFNTNAQTISYPHQSSQLLKSTADDVAMLFNKAVNNGQFITDVYTAIPSSGIVFIYDSTITGNQACKVESDGINFIRFSAAQDNGLCFGIYQYLHYLGFRFYQPGSIWEIIPKLSTVYKKGNSIYNSAFKYSSWFVSGGHNRWAMDSNNNYGWDVYFGENGHNWALYQRRNGMNGAYRFTGHRGDIMSGNYYSTIQNNPCFVACHDSSRQASSRSVPDVNNVTAMQLWSTTIEQKYTLYRNAIFGNTGLYVNQFRNFNYNSYHIGIEVPDGAKWGNTIDNNGCGNSGYGNESDQHFTLADHTVNKISNIYPNLRFQLYAYSAHADVPSPQVSINDKLDIQLIPAVYQNITSTNGLRNRWYSRTKNISEYNYFNLSGWSGETPAFDLDEFKKTVQIAKNKKSQGIVWESSPAKFASLPYLLAANKNLLSNESIDNTLQEFCDNMFASAGKTVYGLLQLWADKKNLVGGISNRYRIPLYLQLISDAEQQILHDEPVVKERVRELKAYLHYMIMYYDWAGDQRTNEAKKEKAAALCIYLAKINKMQLVNSYFLITNITSKFAGSSYFYQQYNTYNGQAYLNGNLPLITTSEIDNDFRKDIALYNNVIKKYQFESTDHIANRFAAANIIPLKKITVKLNYTNGIDYYNRSEFFIKSPVAGSFSIKYTPAFDLTDKGYINFTVESTDNVLEIIKDFSIDRNAQAGTLNIEIPNAGNYKLTVSSKYRSSVELEINTNKNIFYKSGTFFGKATEIYKNDVDMPGYFYIPAGMNKIYFSLDNSNPAGTGFASEEKINNAFAIQDNNGKTLTARFVTPIDSALFYIDIPEESKGKFCKITKKRNYDLVFSNISNYLWFAGPRPAPCPEADFTVSVINKNGNCITRLKAVSKTGQFNWEVNDLGRTYFYNDLAEVELPDYSSPNAFITLTNGSNCSNTKKVGDDVNFLKAKQACGSGAPVAEVQLTPAIFPNPSSGVFSCLKNGTALTATEIIISNTQGARVGNFKNVNHFDISDVPAGLYWYKIIVMSKEFNGKLIKL